MVAGKRALITGGAGFIGSHLADELVARGFTVVVLDNLSSGRLCNLAHLKRQVEFVEGDIRDGDLLQRVVADCQLVFHHAALVSVAHSVGDPPGACEVNDLGTVRVLDACRRLGVRRVVLASSGAVYGEAPQLPASEKMAPAPLSPYAVAKLSGEWYAAVFSQLYGLETVCLRYFNVYGPRQDPTSPYSGVISIFLDRACAQKAPVIHGDGRQSRDFIHVADVVRANWLAASVPAAAGQIFNVGGGRSRTIGALWAMIADLTGVAVAPVHQPARDGDIRHSLADINSIGTKLGFSPRVGLRQGLRETLAWYRHRRHSVAAQEATAPPDG